MRNWLWLALVCIALGCGKQGSAPTPTPPTGWNPANDSTPGGTDDEQMILGDWIVQTLDEGQGPKPVENFTIQFSREKMTLRQKGEVDEFAYLLDKSSQPRSFTNWKPTDEKAKFLGLYELKGSQLTLVINEKVGSPRPTELTAKQQPHRINQLILTRK